MALQAHFNLRRNTVAEQHAFRKRAQAQNESLLQYVAALRDLATTCEFADKQDEMIRDHLLEHVISHRIRERLLLETDLTLAKAIILATQIEAAGEKAKSISDTHTAPVHTIQTKSSTEGHRHSHRSRSDEHLLLPAHSLLPLVHLYRHGTMAALTNTLQTTKAVQLLRLSAKTIKRWDTFTRRSFQTHFVHAVT